MNLNVTRKIPSVLVTMGFAMGLLVLNIAPAQAHHPIVSGEAVCAEDGHQTITWTVTNSESVEGTNRAMTIDQVAIDRGDEPFTVGQEFAPTPLPGSSQDGTSTYGGAEAGAVILTVRVDFSGRGAPQDVERSATVVLVGDCEAVTTTTTQPVTTSTTEQEGTTTTTLPVCVVNCEPVGCQSSSQPGCGPSTTTTKPPVTGTTAMPSTVEAPVELPHTGAASRVLMGLAGALMLLGVGLRKFVRKA